MSTSLINQNVVFRKSLEILNTNNQNEMISSLKIEPEIIALKSYTINILIFKRKSPLHLSMQMKMISKVIKAKT